MKRSPSTTVLGDGDGPYAVLIKADYVAEHEEATTGIDRMLGLAPVAPGNVGLPARTMRSRPDVGHVLHVEAMVPPPVDRARRGRRPLDRPPTSAGILTLSRYDPPPHASTPGDLPGRLAAKRPQGFVDGLLGSWDRDAFEIVGHGPEAMSVVSMLWRALEGGTLAVWRRPERFPVVDAGLAIADAARVPPPLATLMEDADIEGLALLAAAAATGIADRLREAGKPYFALTPSWPNDVTRRSVANDMSRHPVVFWLNPMDQEAARWGWYTVEQLDAWIDGSGPVPKAGVDPRRSGGAEATLAQLSWMAGRR